MQRKLLLASVLAAAAIGTVIPATAAAAGNFSCRASAARAVTFGTPPLAAVEPVRANPDSLPCSTQSSETLHPTTIAIITADAVRAYTTLKATVPAAASSQAIVSVPKISLGGLNIKVDAVTSQASATCGPTGVTFAGSSKLVNLTINGGVIALPGGDAQQKLSLGALGSLTVNEQIKTATGITQRALHLKTPLADVVLAESTAGTDGGDPCTGIVPGGPRPCPLGSDYDAPSNLCVIHLPGTTRVIVVGRPYAGPSGGRVITLPDARKRFHSSCLNGPGPRYAVIGTSKNDHITGTNSPDRILGLGGNDSLDGGRGNDCLDGGRGGDALNGGIGKDRVFGSAGADRLNGGPSADRLSGGRGNDTINAAFGKDVVTGGAGNDHINVATAGPLARVNCGSGFDKVRLNKGEDKIARHCEVIFITKRTKGKH